VLGRAFLILRRDFSCACASASINLPIDRLLTADLCHLQFLVPTRVYYPGPSQFSCYLVRSRSSSFEAFHRSYTLRGESRRTFLDIDLRKVRTAYKMAPAATGSPLQADTPMTDANDDVIPSVPVDALTVCDSVFQSHLSKAIVAFFFLRPGLMGSFISPAPSNNNLPCRVTKTLQTTR
jgi:hypothetical protein